MKTHPRNLITVILWILDKSKQSKNHHSEFFYYCPYIVVFQGSQVNSYAWIIKTVFLLCFLGPGSMTIGSVIRAARTIRYPQL